MHSGDLLVCAFLKPAEVGCEFERWPLHVTIAPWFRLEAVSRAEFLSGLVEALNTQAPIAADIGAQQRLGSARVALVTNREDWLELHNRVLALVRESAKITVPSPYVGKSYLPHVTVRHNLELKAGESITCDTLYLVERTAGGRKVVGNIKLGELK